jgi:hypothetical protein
MTRSPLDEGQLVVVTDFGTVPVPERVAKAYRGFYFRRRAPKKSVRQAMERLNADVQAMMHYSWVMGGTKPKW